MKVGFVFNHDALHQIAHTAPVAAALAARGVAVSVLTSSAAQTSYVRALLPAASGVSYLALRIGRAARALDWLARGVAPWRRIAVLRENLPIFATFDALVVPETTSALLRTRWSLPTRLIYLPHGAGDRSVGFRQVTRAFDFVLVAGTKIRDRMLEAGLIRPGHYAVVGYPKFDTVALDARPRWFANDRPTVLYNPHFDPLLSSWYDDGIAVLDWFAAQDRFNLIFAPHVMLFRRRVHASVEHRRTRWRRDLPSRFAALPHLRIDTGSDRSVDMSYTLGADIYLGDVSSQVYEWVVRPRPCIFLNTNGGSGMNNLEYAASRMGETIGGVAELSAALDRAVADPRRYGDVQVHLRDETFDPSGVPAAERAAQAIIEFMQR